MDKNASGDGAPGRNERSDPKVQLFLKVVTYVVIMAAITFLVAGRMDWEMGWAYFAAYLVTMSVGVAVAPLDQELIDERTKIMEDVKRWDKVMAGLLSPVYPFGLFVVVGLEMRFGQALLFPLWVQVTGLVVSVLGQLLSSWAMASNKFYGRFVRIQRDRGQYVVTDGPYRIVRHPGYMGVILAALGTAFAIGSLWALVLSTVVSIMLIVRTAPEDRVLREELEGYKAYAKEIRFRLVPGIW